MARILILYSTTDGHTRKICDRLQSLLEPRGHQVEVVSITQDPAAKLERFDAIVIGASIRYGKHSPRLFDFIHRHARLLNQRPSAFFSVSVSARKAKNSRPETNPYMRKFLRKVSWRPGQLAVFAGKIDYPRYTFFDRFMIRFIMWITGGPTDPQAVVEFTDWGQVEAFARLIGVQDQQIIPSLIQLKVHPGLFDTLNQGYLRYRVAWIVPAMTRRKSQEDG